LLNKGNGLNNWFILPVHISGTLVSREAMTKTELGSSHIIILNLLHDFDKMGSDSSVKLSDGVVVSGSESSSSKNFLSHLWVGDTKQKLLLFGTLGSW